MTIELSTVSRPRPGDQTQRRAAMVTASSLLLMALLAPFAQFGALQTLIVPADAAATTNNIAASLGLFVAAIVAFLIVAVLDVVVARGLYIFLRPVNENLALLVGWLRVVYGVVFAGTLLYLFDAARLVQGATPTALDSGTLQAQVAAAVESFDVGWRVALGIFSLHLIGLGALLLRYAAPPLLAALVVVAGVGYLADAAGTIVVADYGMTISTVTFVGEAVLIVWLFWRAARGRRSSEATADAARASAPIAS